jgi:cytochrome c
MVFRPIADRRNGQSLDDQEFVPMTLVHRSVVVLSLTLIAPAVHASPELARSKNCVACHSAERKMIGPSYKAIAERHANDASSVKALSEKVQKGGGGVWGPMPMPAQANVSPEEAEALVAWILTHK